MSSTLGLASHFVRSILEESRAVEKALFEPHRIQSKPQKSRFRALILPGFIAPRFVYHRLVKFLDALGIFSVVATYGMNPRAQLLREPKILEETVLAFREAFGTLDYVVAHSTGSIEGISLIPDYPEVRKVVAFAPPLTLTAVPRTLLHLGARLGLAPVPLHPERMRKLVRRLKPHQERIVLVYTREDRLCRPAHHVFPTAKHIVVEEEVPKISRHLDIDSSSHTHIGLPNSSFAKSILKRELA